VSEPVLNGGRGFAALREMSSAGMFESVHVSFIRSDAGKPAILFHELIQPNPRDSLRTLPRGKKRARLRSAIFHPGPQNSQLFITEGMLTGNRTFPAPNVENTIPVIEVRHLQESDFMSPEPAMVSNPENSPIALAFDD
jgi:hypothetical protein